MFIVKIKNTSLTNNCDYVLIQKFDFQIVFVGYVLSLFYFNIWICIFEYSTKLNWLAVHFAKSKKRELFFFETVVLANIILSRYLLVLLAKKNCWSFCVKLIKKSSGYTSNAAKNYTWNWNGHTLKNWLSTSTSLMSNRNTSIQYVEVFRKWT